jgi:hypothetical protein
MNVWYVYVDSKSDTGQPFYVGKGNLARVNRKERNRYHCNIVQKHGLCRNVVFQTNNEREALDKEISLIKELKTRDCYGGANFTDGGDGVSGFKHSHESLEKNRLAHIGRTQHVNTCMKKSISMCQSSRVHRMSVDQTDTQTNKIIAVYSSVCAAARSIGKPFAASLISRCCRGKVKTFAGYGWKYSDSMKVMITQPHVVSSVKHVQQLTFSGDLIDTHGSIAAAARSINKSSGSIRLCCLGRRETAYGFRWQFHDGV